MTELQRLKARVQELEAKIKELESKPPVQNHFHTHHAPNPALWQYIPQPYFPGYPTITYGNGTATGSAIYQATGVQATYGSEH